MNHDDLGRSGAFAGPYLSDRLASDLLSICRGLLMDGAVVDREIDELARWGEKNPTAAREWPGSVIVPRIQAILADGEVDEDERRELHLLLEEMTGYRRGSQGPVGGIFTEPPPTEIRFDASFTLTGTFAFGTRTQVSAVVELLGGEVVDRIVKRTEYLIVGTASTPAWREAGYGTKIEDAMARNRIFAGGRGDERPVIILPEALWVKLLPPEALALAGRKATSSGKKKNRESRSESPSSPPPGSVVLEVHARVVTDSDSPGRTTRSQDAAPPKPAERPSGGGCGQLALIVILALTIYAIVGALVS